MGKKPNGLADLFESLAKRLQEIANDPEAAQAFAEQIDVKAMKKAIRANTPAPRSKRKRKR